MITLFKKIVALAFLFVGFTPHSFCMTKEEPISSENENGIIKNTYKSFISYSTTIEGDPTREITAQYNLRMKKYMSMEFHFYNPIKRASCYINIPTDPKESEELYHKLKSQFEEKS